MTINGVKLSLMHLIIVRLIYWQGLLTFTGTVLHIVYNRGILNFSRIFIWSKGMLTVKTYIKGVTYGTLNAFIR